MATSPSVLLTVSGTIPEDLDEQVAAGVRPRADYRVLAARLQADVIDVPAALAGTGRTGRLLLRFAGVGPLLGWYSFRHKNRYDVLLTDGEQVGLPYALLTSVFGRGRARHVMIVHVLSAPKKVRLVRVARLANRVDRYLVYCTRQRELLSEGLGVSDDRIVLIPFMVDTDFFTPEQVTAPRRRMICSAGLERRDYPTLMDAVEGLDVEVVIAAASPWSKQADSSSQRALPPNVAIRRLTLFELRELYAQCQLVVMPLVEVDFQAGITTILEAMSMARTVVCTRTAGQIDTIVDGETGVYVPPGDAVALRRSIDDLLGDEARMAAIGNEARSWAVAHARVDRYAGLIAEVVDSLGVGSS